MGKKGDAQRDARSRQQLPDPSIMSRARQGVRSFARPMGILTRGIASPKEVPKVKGKIQKNLNQGPDLRKEL